MKKLLILFLLITSSVFSQSTSGDIIGTVVDFGSNQTLINARCWVEDNGRKYGSVTDIDGRFRIIGVPSGKYVLTIVERGDTNQTNVDVPIESYYNLGTFEFQRKTKTMGTITVVAPIRLINGDLPLPQLSAKEIKFNPNKFDIKTMASGMSSEIQRDDEGELSFRGSRKGDMIYVIDGIKSPEVYNVPSCSISKMMVYTGGLPAKYGDTLGGAIVVETKGYFELYREWLANQ